MPCDTITTQTLATGLQNAVPELLVEALRSMGFKGIEQSASVIVARTSGSTRVRWDQGEGLVITSSNSEFFAREITKAYSRAAVSWAAKRAGWQVSTLIEDNKLQITRR